MHAGHDYLATYVSTVDGLWLINPFCDAELACPQLLRLKIWHETIPKIKAVFPRIINNSLRLPCDKRISSAIGPNHRLVHVVSAAGGWWRWRVVARIIAQQPAAS